MQNTLYQLTQTRHGAMLANPRDHYIGAGLIEFGEYCHAEWQLLEQLIKLTPTHSLLLEVGANCGSHTVPMAQLAANRGQTLLAFEPQPVVFQQLCANLALGSLTNALAYPVACGETAGVLHMPALDYTQHGNFGGISVLSQPGATGVPAQCVVLDDFCAALYPQRPVGLAKIDVEGFELAVLKGMQKHMLSDRPLLYVEADRTEASVEMIQWLLAQDYDLWWHLPPLYNPNNWRNAPNSEAAGSVVSINLIGAHKSVQLKIGDLEPVREAKPHPIVLGDSFYKWQPPAA